MERLKLRTDVVSIYIRERERQTERQTETETGTEIETDR